MITNMLLSTGIFCTKCGETDVRAISTSAESCYILTWQGKLRTCMLKVCVPQKNFGTNRVLHLPCPTMYHICMVGKQKFVNK